MTPTRRKLSVPEYAKQLGVAEKKIRDFIQSRELRAINLARSTQGRPRYAIDVDDIAAFEKAREVIPDSAPSTSRKSRKRTAGQIKDYFED